MIPDPTLLPRLAEALSAGCSPALLERLTRQTAATVKVGVRHWLIPDDGETYCENCIEAAVAKSGTDWDGGFEGESDGFDFCATCCVPINGTLTDYGIDAEITGLEDSCLGEIDAHIAHELAVHYADAKTEGRLAQICWRFMHDSRYGSPVEEEHVKDGEAL